MADAAAWEQQADAEAARLGAAIDGLQETWPGPNTTFRLFWLGMKDVSERIRTAPAIKLDDKLHLQYRVHELCLKARAEQKERRERLSVLETRAREVLDLAEETLNGNLRISTVQEVRADLALLRDQIQPFSGILRKSGLWERWQAVNKATWTRLTELWGLNEGRLSALLDEASTSIERGDPRGAKEAVKKFHTTAGELECSHRVLRVLRSRANGIWKQADKMSREKHAQYLRHAAGRVERWKQAQARRSRERVSIERDIGALEIELDRASTGIGQALLRGRIEERKKALSVLLSEERDIQRQIESAEQARARG